MKHSPEHASPEGYRGPYRERSGESAAALVGALVEQPERPLGAEDLQAAYEFEHQLSEHKLASGESIETFIKSVRGEDQVAPLVFPEYILDGSVDVQSFNAPSLSTHEDVYVWFAQSVRDNSLTSKQMTALAKQTALAYKARIATAIIEDTSLSAEDQAMRPIVVDPAEIISGNRDAYEVRQFLLKTRRQYHEDMSDLDGAKRAILDVYLARINGIIAGLIPPADYLVAQSELIGDRETAGVAREVIPPSIRSALQNDTVLDRALPHESVRVRTLRRLDYMRNGLGLDRDGRASAIAAVGLAAVRGETRLEEGAVFTAEETKRLKDITLEPDEMVVLFEQILDKAGLLSQEDSATWDSKRRHRAADELFQVVINPDKQTFAVDGVSGAYKVPSVPTSLYRVLTVGGFHELQHVSQSQSDRLAGTQLRIAEIKGRRPTMLREGGANAIQREAELRLFGVAKPIAATYSRALQVIENGGGTLEASRAFYNEKMRVVPSASPQETALEAADRILRLVRGGGQNSTSLSYGEEAILADQLEGASPEVVTRATALTGLDLVDQVSLHKYGLLPDIPESFDWTEVTLNVMQSRIEQAVAA